MFDYNHVGSVWYHSESSDVRYILQTSFLVWTFFAASYSKRALTEKVCKCGSTRGHNHKSRLIVPMFTRVAESVLTLVGGLRRTYTVVAELAHRGPEQPRM